jgi:hypothetical protein
MRPIASPRARTMQNRSPTIPIRPGPGGLRVDEIRRIGAGRVEDADDGAHPAGATSSHCNPGYCQPASRRCRPPAALLIMTAPTPRHK